MKFEITKEQAEQILNTLVEFPAKQVLTSVDILRNLKPVEEGYAEEAS